MSTHSPNLWKILSEASRVIIAHPRHFFTLSVIFILPMSLSPIIYTILYQPTSFHQSFFSVSTSSPDIPPAGKPQLLIPILYLLFIFLYGICGNASITYSTFNGFHGKPITLISSLKSILVSYFPLLATLLANQLILMLIGFAYAIFMVLVYGGLALFEVEMSYQSGYFLASVFLTIVLFLTVMVYLQVGWCLTTVVVVVESKWGFEPLKRSWYLVKGMRWVVFSMVLMFGVLVGLLTFWFSSLVANAGVNGWGIITVLQLLVYAGVSAVLSLCSMASVTVLFVYCKELHGETEFKIDEELGLGYRRVPMDDGATPKVVSFV